MLSFVKGVSKVCTDVEIAFSGNILMNIRYTANQLAYKFCQHSASCEMIAYTEGK